MKLRKNQKLILSKLIDLSKEILENSRINCENKMYFSAPTSSGKTFILSNLIKLYDANKNKLVIFEIFINTTSNMNWYKALNYHINKFILKKDLCVNLILFMEWKYWKYRIYSFIKKYILLTTDKNFFNKVNKELNLNKLNPLFIIYLNEKIQFYKFLCYEFIKIIKNCLNKFKEININRIIIFYSSFKMNKKLLISCTFDIDKVDYTCYLPLSRNNINLYRKIDDKNFMCDI